jgi:hypothetical protein
MVDGEHIARRFAAARTYEAVVREHAIPLPHLIQPHLSTQATAMLLVSSPGILQPVFTVVAVVLACFCPVIVRVFFIVPTLNRLTVLWMRRFPFGDRATNLRTASLGFVHGA